MAINHENSVARPGRCFTTGCKAAEVLGISQQTLRSYADNGKIGYIRTPGGKRRYDINNFVRDHVGCDTASRSIDERKSVIYARVSTRKQKGDLEHQVDFLRRRFPDFEVITDIGSGVNFNRRGFKRILELALSRNLLKLAISHRDRLCRISFDLVEWILQRHGCQTIVVQNEHMGKGTHEEFVDDIISIMHSFSARTYGRRSYKPTGRKEDEDVQTSPHITDEESSR